MGAENEFGQTSGSGWFDGACHVLPLRVYYEDTDAAGIVYYANYLRFAERARTEMMRCLGAEHSTLMVDQGIAFAVRNCDAEYLQPARLDDAIVVKTEVREVRGASMRADQTVARREDDGTETELVRLHIRLACMDSELKPARLPRAVRTSLGELTADALTADK